MIYHCLISVMIQNKCMRVLDINLYYEGVWTWASSHRDNISKEILIARLCIILSSLQQLAFIILLRSYPV